MPVIPPSTKFFLREMSISTKSFLREMSVSTKSFINIRYAVHNRKAAFRSVKDGLLQDER